MSSTMHDLLSALRETDGLAPSRHAFSKGIVVESSTERSSPRTRLPTVPEDPFEPEEPAPTKIKSPKLALWQKMEVKVTGKKAKKTKEPITPTKQMIPTADGSVDAPDGETNEEGFTEKEIFDLRLELGAFAKVYDGHESRPVHPKHHCTWHSTFLRCTVCTTSCGICGAACCKYKNLIVSKALANPESDEAQAKAAVIKRVEYYMGTGIDPPTFLKCTECKILVCPDCCGQCPVKMCKDLRCKNCVEDPWERCEWHDEDD